jgi:hypothetical protein
MPQRFLGAAPDGDAAGGGYVRLPFNSNMKSPA